MDVLVMDDADFRSFTQSREGTEGTGPYTYYKRGSRLAKTQVTLRDFFIRRNVTNRVHVVIKPKSPRLAMRVAVSLSIGPPPPGEPPPPLEVPASPLAAHDPLRDLQQAFGTLIGQDRAKAEILHYLTQLLAGSAFPAASTGAAASRKEDEDVGPADVAARAGYLLFVGGKGTGKSVVGRILATALHSAGVTSSPALQDDSAAATSPCWRTRPPGVCLVNSASALDVSSLHHLHTLLNGPSQDSFVVLSDTAAGWSVVSSAAPSLVQGAARIITFDSYSLHQLAAIASLRLTSMGYTVNSIINDTLEDEIRSRFDEAAMARHNGDIAVRISLQMRRCVQLRNSAAATASDAPHTLLQQDVLCAVDLASRDLH